MTTHIRISKEAKAVIDRWEGKSYTDKIIRKDSVNIPVNISVNNNAESRLSNIETTIAKLQIQLYKMQSFIDKHTGNGI